MAVDVAGVARGMALLEPGSQVSSEVPQRIGRVEHLTPSEFELAASVA
jgi:hypothetical protein